jgi:alkylation response protein AidB-like acyl-CoA dehydrogenase
VNRRLSHEGAGPTDATLFFGLALAGPMVVAHGSAELRERLLRPMFTGEHLWCQLFSEPGAGSDLAGLATRAERDGDEWVISGQKVWNTLAHVADRGMLVARTDPSAPKH